MIGALAVFVLSFLSFESVGFILWYLMGKVFTAWWTADIDTILNAGQVWMASLPLVHVFLFLLACIITLKYIFNRRVIIVMGGG